MTEQKLNRRQKTVWDAMWNAGGNSGGPVSFVEMYHEVRRMPAKDLSRVFGKKPKHVDDYNWLMPKITKTSEELHQKGFASGRQRVR
jgi:hypothetical protein